jgi:putative ABC transport system substrate-binding protein
VLVAEAGGLVSYGASVYKILRRTGYYVRKILDGADPSNLPIEQPTRLELVINLRTAKKLGIEVSPTLLARADEVIE